MATPNPNILLLQSTGDVDALIEALQNPEAATRKSAAVALRALTAVKAVPALKTALAAEQDESTKSMFAATLEDLEREVNIKQMVESKDIQGLTKLLSSSNIDDIKAACQGLGATGDRHAAEPLVILFRNPLQSNAARLAAADALLKLESAPAVVTLLGALRRDNWQVRRNAAAVLGQLQAGWATEALIIALNDPHQAVQRTVAAALRRIGSPEAVQAVNDFEEIQKRVNAGTQPLPAPEGVEPAATPAPVAETPPVEPAAESSPTASRMVKWKEATQVSGAVKTTEMPNVVEPAATPTPASTEQKPVTETQTSEAPNVVEPAPETTQKKPITGPLPRPPWLLAKDEPPTHLDDTKPSRPTQLKSPLKDIIDSSGALIEPKPDDKKQD